MFSLPIPVVWRRRSPACGQVAAVAAVRAELTNLDPNPNPLPQPSSYQSYPNPNPNPNPRCRAHPARGRPPRSWPPPRRDGAARAAAVERDVRRAELRIKWAAAARRGVRARRRRLG